MLRDYQTTLAKEGADKLARLKILLLALEMRVGKTLTALEVAKLSGAKCVLFLSKKKALGSIKKDYDREGYESAFELILTNHEQAKNVTRRDYDLVILDESHVCGAFPKPTQRTQAIKSLVGERPLIMLSGTPSPETYAQLYHQFALSRYSPWARYRNFYDWSRDYVNMYTRIINGLTIRDYSRTKPELVKADIAPYVISYTQAEAGFEFSEIEERVHYVEMRENTYVLMSQLLQDGVVYVNAPMFASHTIKADSAAALKSKIHQLCSGTVIDDKNKTLIVDLSKVRYILEKFKGQKVAIFYQYIAEGDLLRRYFTADGRTVTSDPEEFNNSTDKVFICQTLSGSQGVNLETAEALIFYNINFSAVQYFQARARAQSKDAKRKTVVHWIFAKDGIEEKIYNAVQRKKTYTSSYFKRDFKTAAREPYPDSIFGGLVGA